MDRYLGAEIPHSRARAQHRALADCPIRLPTPPTHDPYSSRSVRFCNPPRQSVSPDSNPHKGPMSDLHSLPSLTPLELSPPSPSPSPSPSPRPAAACCFFKASISSAVKNRPPLPRGREQAWRCRLSCRYGFVGVSFSANVGGASGR